MSMQSILVSASGEDRPGLVAAVTRVLYEMGGNLEDSAMTRLEGAFAMLMVASFDSGQIEALRQALVEVGRDAGLSVQVKIMTEAEARTPAPGGSPYIISLYGADKPGLVYRVATLLEHLHVNITDVVTHRSAASLARGPLYQLVFEVELPSVVDVDDFRTRLAELGRELQVEIVVNRMEIVEL